MIRAETRRTEVAVRLPDGSVTEVHRDDEVLDATLTGREYVTRRAVVLGGTVVQRTTRTVTTRTDWRRAR